MTMLGFAELEAEDDIGVAELLPAPSVSLSLALSAMAVRQCVKQGRMDDSSCRYYGKPKGPKFTRKYTIYWGPWLFMTEKYKQR